MWPSRTRSRTKNTSRSRGAVRGVQWTFSINSAYLLKSQSENKKFSWSVWIIFKGIPKWQWRWNQSFDWRKREISQCFFKSCAQESLSCVCTHSNAFFIVNANIAIKIWIFKYFWEKVWKADLSSVLGTHSKVPIPSVTYWVQWLHSDWTVTV